MPPTPLLYRKPQEGRDYWILDGALKDPEAVIARAFAREDWIYGFPHKQEPWPGMRALIALTPEELEPIEAFVRKATGSKRLWQGSTPEGATLNHNCFQLVGREESGPRPHTDSLKLCRYAAVIYLNPKPPEATGTTFFRLRLRDGKLGGNMVQPPATNLVDALGTGKMPLEAWAPEMELENRFNRLVVYKAALVHSATRYFGREPKDRRLTAVFFWMAE
jgi:hypothetical protein